MRKKTGGTMQRFIDVKELLQNKELLSILALSIYNPTEERLNNRAMTYMNNPSTAIYAIQEDDLFIGIIVLDIADREKIEILNIAVASYHQKAGVGSSLINNCIEKFHPKEIIAETDDDAVGFYRRFRFEVGDLGDKYGAGIRRYQCTYKC
jgi:ribosomal protein S18 acetylase RimI-like enzyme